MNARKLSQLFRPRNLTPLIIVLFTLLVVGFGLSSGTAQSGQDGAAESASDERKFENNIPAHVPIKVKLKNEQSFKKKDNKNWARELEIEVKNTGTKPIYFMYMIVDMPDVRGENGHSYAFQLHYGRKELMNLDTAVLPDDVPIRPGESVTLKPYESRVVGYEALRRSKNKDDPKKVRFDMQIVNFGDGTGLHGVTGTPAPKPSQKRLQNTPTQKGVPEDCPPMPRIRGSDAPGKFLKAFYSPVPAISSRVLFSPLDDAPASDSAPPLPDQCGCQNIYSCFYGKFDCAGCPCDDTCIDLAFVPTGSCSARGACWRTEAKNITCPTQYNGEQQCQFEEGMNPCAEGDPTPTPTPHQPQLLHRHRRPIRTQRRVTRNPTPRTASS